VEHGASVETGVNTSLSPTVLQVPATAGSSVGWGVRRGGAAKATTSGCVPLAIPCEAGP